MDFAAEFPGEMMPDLLYRTVYRGTSANGSVHFRFVEAVGADAAPSGHPYRGVHKVRYRLIFDSGARFSQARYCDSAEFMVWKNRMGASVDITLTRWVRDLMKAPSQAEPAQHSARSNPGRTKS